MSYAFTEKKDLSMVAEQIAAERIEAVCNDLNMDYELMIDELKDDLEDIAEGVLTDRTLRFVVRTLALMRGWP